MTLTALYTLADGIEIGGGRRETIIAGVVRSILHLLCT